MWYPILITVLTAYALGNLNGAVMMSTLIANEDVRIHGSGNAGMTNFARNYGGFGTVLVLLVDMGKAALACILGGLLLQPYGLEQEGMILGGICVFIGHDFPALLGFRGGKGIASGCAIALVIDWRIGLLIIAAFLLLYLCTGYVSLGSVAGAISYAAGFAILHYQQPWVMAGGVFIGLLALFMHRSNIVRLLKGQEQKTKLFQKRKKS